MVAFVTDPISKPHPPGPKNRVWKKFPILSVRVRSDRPPAQKPCREEAATTTKSASDVFYYGYRYYNADTGRWLNRDPINEPGSMLVRDEKEFHLDEELNLYAFVGNDPISTIDVLGLKGRRCCSETWIINARGGSAALGAGGGYFYGTAVCAGDESNSRSQHIACGALGLGAVFGSFNATVTNVAYAEDLSGIQFAGSYSLGLGFGWGRFSVSFGGGNVSGGGVFYGSPVQGMWIPCTLQ